MICPICRTPETKWKNVDSFRLKEEGMSMCESCGFISYPTKYRSKAEIIEYYRKEYRQPPNVNNIYTGERKIQYHAHFLNDVFEKWRKDKRKDLVITDVGSAFGLFLNWARHQLTIDGHQPEVIGVELTTSFVRNAWHLFQIKSLPEFDTSKEYDLISSYKSLEHILDPDVELTSYIDCLKNDGYLYFSVPIWFEALKNFGQQGFDIEYYFSTNHINTWTLKHVKGLIAVCGGEIVNENHTMYESTFLIKRNLALRDNDRKACFDNTERIMDCLRHTQQAAEAFQTGDYAKAIAAWPNFPAAWHHHYEMQRKPLNALGFEKIYTDFCQKALEACNNDADIHCLIADICARYDQYEKAVEHLNLANQLRPNQPNVFSLLSNCFRDLGKHATDPEQQSKFYEKSRACAKILGDVASQHKGESMTWMMFDNANMPTPFEGK